MKNPTINSNSCASEFYLLTLLFLIAVVGLRIGFIAMCGTNYSYSMTPALTAAVFLAIGIFYTFVRHHAFIATLFNALGLVHLAFLGAMPSAALVFYVGREFPLVDAQMAAIDQALAFDWPAYVQWFDRHVVFNAVAEAAYQSIFAQPFLIVLSMALTHQSDRLYAFITIMVVALLITCVIAVFLPALGPYEFFDLDVADHPNIDLITQDKMTAPIEWLRAADFNAPRPPVTVGLISFPSYHSATAIIYVWAAWRTPYFRWAIVAANGMLLLATPVHGSHYLVDVIAGVAIAIASIAATQSAFAALAKGSAARRVLRLPGWLEALAVRRFHDRRSQA
jgi:hypothetical protein